MPAPIPAPMFDVDGRVVIITGGAGLIGRAYARALSEAGAHPVIADLDIESAQAVAASVDGAEAFAIQVDVTDPSSTMAMAETCQSRFGRIDALVNNAAIDPKMDKANAGQHLVTFENYPVDAFRLSLDVGVTGAFLCTQAGVPAMRDAGRGVIINVASTYGMAGPDQRLYINADGTRSIKPVAYSVSKSAMFGFTKYLAAYFADSGLRANTLTLGGVFNDHDDGFTARYEARTPLGRMARQDEYVGTLLYLVSDASAYMTGANVVIDGGWTAW
ncbi:MAG: SDR family oxidoreductase [Bacteroidota bacterium]